MRECVELIEQDNGIHELIFHEATRQAVDDYIVLVAQIINKQIAGNESAAHILMNLTESGAPPFTYVTQQGLALLHEHLKDRSQIHIKSAFLAKESTKTVLSLAEAFVEMLPIDVTFKVFDWTKRGEAEEWLMSDG